MQWRKLAWVVIGLIFLALPLEAQGARKRVPRAKAEAKEAGPTYQAALLMEADTGAILFEQESHKKWPPASMAKMMLMLLVMERVKEGSIKLSDTTTVSARASKMGGSQVFLKEGEQFTLEDLMKATVVASANDAAVAIAEHVAGTVEAFVELMNARARQLGLNDTRYSSVHGLPPEKGEEGDITSAYDLTILARELLKYPDVIRWGSIAEDKFRDGKFVLTNTNHLLRSFNGANGIKTGYIKESGFSVTATAKRGDMQLIAVILGAPRSKLRFSEAARLLGTGFAMYKKVVVVAKGAPVGQPVEVAEGKIKKTQLVAASDLVAVVKKGEEKGLAIALEKVNKLQAPLKRSQPAGQITVKVKDQVVAKGVAVVNEDIYRAGFFRRLLKF